MSTCETVNKSGKSDFCCIDSELPVDPGSARHGRAPEFRKTTGDTFQNVSPQAVEKVEHSWAFSHLYGKISMGDERCLNEGSWIVES